MIKCCSPYNDTLSLKDREGIRNRADNKGISTDVSLVSGSKKTSITALYLQLKPVIYKSKLLSFSFFASLVLDAFLKPFEKYGVFLVALVTNQVSSPYIDTYSPKS